MRNTDFIEFSAMLDDVAGLKRETYTAGQKAMFFRAVKDFSLDEVTAGLDAHVKDPKAGRWLPMPADVIGQILTSLANDNRPGPEEAWAKSLRSRYEADTVIWTDEMAQAWAEARSLMELGDEVGARMAFKETYNRLVLEARQARRPTNWTISEGYDAVRRVLAIQAAIEAGVFSVERLSRDQVAPLMLEAPKQATADGDAPQLEGIAKVLAFSEADPARAADVLALRERLARRHAPEPETVGDERAPLPDWVGAVLALPPQSHSRKVH